jgi:hypothetical protein
MGSIVDLLDQPKHELVFSTQSQSISSEKDFPHISSPLARVCIETEEGVQLGNSFWAEDWVLRSNIFGEDCFKLFILYFFLGHDKS